MLQPLYTPMENMGPKGSPPIVDMAISPSGTIIDLTLYVKFKTNTFSKIQILIWTCNFGNPWLLKVANISSTT